MEHFDQRAALPSLGCGGFGGVVVMVTALAFVVVKCLLYGKAHLVAVVVMGQTFERSYRRQGKRHKEYGQQLFHSRCKDTNFTTYCQYLFVGIFLQSLARAHYAHARKAKLAAAVGAFIRKKV